jgi:hypothetical protein
MTTLADACGFDLPEGEIAIGAKASANGHVVICRPTLRWPFITTPKDHAMTERKDRPGVMLIAAAGLLLAALAAAMGIVSWHAQYAFIYAIKHQELAAALEALGLDCGAVIFSVLGIALARLGRRAVIERILVCICAAGSCAMNAAGANLGSPRSVAAFVMPPVLFAITSDRLVSVIRRSALGPKADAESQRSAWRAAGVAALYMLRLVAAPPSTVTGARRALLDATPLPEPVRVRTGAKSSAQPGAAGIAGSPRPVRKARRARVSKAGPTKTGRFLGLVAERHGPLSEFPLADVSKVATAIAPDVDLHPGSARAALRSAVLAAQDGEAR